MEILCTFNLESIRQFNNNKYLFGNLASLVYWPVGSTALIAAATAAEHLIHTPLSISTRFRLACFGILSVISIDIYHEYNLLSSFGHVASKCPVHVHDPQKRFQHSREVDDRRKNFLKMFKTFSNHLAYTFSSCQHMHVQ